MAARAYRIPNDKLFTFNTPGGRPRCRRSGLDKLGRLTFQFRVFLDSFDGNLENSERDGTS
jgi:hypothetical protein